MTVKCLMLDVDGVLIDGRPEDGQHWKTDLFEDIGVAPGELSEAFFRVDWQDIVCGRKDLLPSLEAALLSMSSPISAEDIIAYWFEKDSRIVEPVLSDCKRAREAGIPVYLTTNQEHKRATYLMETLGLGASVDGIVYSAQAGFQKPQPEFYSFAQDVTGLRPSELLLVDDTYANIEGAIAAGWSATLWDATETLSDVLRRSIGG